MNEDRPSAGSAQRSWLERISQVLLADHLGIERFAAVEEVDRQLMIEMQCVQHQRQRLIQRIIGTVAEKQSRCTETTGAPAYQITNGG